MVNLMDQITVIIAGTVFLLFGITAIGIAILRKGKDFRVLIWLGMWSGIYGIPLLILSDPVASSFPESISSALPYVDVSIRYFILVFALLSWMELTQDKMRIYLGVMAGFALVIGLAGISWFAISRNADTFLIYNNLVTVINLIILLAVLSVKKLSIRFLIFPNRGVLAVATYLFAIEALYGNLSKPLGYPYSPLLGWIGFAILLFSLAYVAAKMIFSNERKLLAIENELKTARQIQFSILPEKVPEINNLDIVAAYYPMAEIAGDFYEFIPLDSDHIGFFVADVSGHGIPAALIASMVKIAVLSVKEVAHDPGEVLKRIGKIMGNQLKGQFVTAAYLYLDKEKNQARYSAAGHPPLIYWDSSISSLKNIESNGLLITGSYLENKYPVFEMTVKSGDRFLLYTDGLTEAQNQNGEFFEDNRLNDLLTTNSNISAKQLNTLLFKELRLWQPAALAQQDDLTWIIIDII